MTDQAILHCDKTTSCIHSIWFEFLHFPFKQDVLAWVGKVFYAPRTYCINLPRLLCIPYSTDTSFPLRPRTLNKPFLLPGISEVKVAQLCLILCDSMDCSLPGSSVHGILQARILEFSPVLQPFSPPGDLPNPGIKPRSSTLQEDSAPSELQSLNKSFLLPGISFSHFSSSQNTRASLAAQMVNSLPAVWETWV